MNTFKKAVSVFVLLRVAVGAAQVDPGDPSPAIASREQAATDWPLDIEYIKGDLETTQIGLSLPAVHCACH